MPRKTTSTNFAKYTDAQLIEIVQSFHSIFYREEVPVAGSLLETMIREHITDRDWDNWNSCECNHLRELMQEATKEATRRFEKMILICLHEHTGSFIK